MEVDFEVEQYSSISHGDSSGIAVMVPQSPLSVIEQDIQGGEIKIVLPFEEELVEVQNMWNIAKVMGLKTSNELVVIDYLSKIKDCKDFTLPRKRGCRKKNKGDH